MFKIKALENKVKFTVLLLFMFAVTLQLSGCTREQNFRGVPNTAWKHLTPEQRQLIVDQSFKSEMKKLECESPMPPMPN